MKAAPFGYLAPASRQEAVDALRRYGPDAKVLAGGQSLVPLLAMRLARPSVLVDLNRVAELAYVRLARGGLTVGAMTRQRTVEHDPRVAERWPLLRAALRWVGHPQIRTRGTIGGSLAHADPAAELPAVALVYGARFVVASSRGERVIPAAEFFTGYLSTALQPDEILTEIRLPVPPPRAGWAFQEIARRHGDFALVGTAALLSGDADRRCIDARLAFIGVSHGPVRIADAEQALIGRRIDAIAAEEVARIVRGTLDPDGDIHASARYRKHVAGVLAARTLLEAAGRMEVSA
ncbi:MAG: xanthine dehydrogenase family protein subunit M [Armatimonadota bacterium]|nr:xanthine dehydrogenase family protein subunit M [Armatimonadota bacterium]